MSDLTELQQQIKETNDLIKALALDIQDIKSQLMYAAKKPVAKAETKATSSFADVKELFTEEHLGVLVIDEQDGFWKVSTNRWLDNKMMFADITDRVKRAGGSWVSAGKASHWKIPKKA